MFSSDKWFGASAGFYPETINQSLRFEDGDSAHLIRTPSSSGDRKTFTISFWTKRANLSTPTPFLFDAYNASTENSFLRFNSDDTLRFSNEISSSFTCTIVTNQVFRDTANWYHIVLAVDTTQSTASNRVKIYVNGEQITSFSSSDYPSLNENTSFNNTVQHTISRAIEYSRYYDGYMAEVNFIDGTALTPSSFGETKNGVWIPKAISGLTYGTNGYRLTFADSSILGDDTSGNGNDFTSSGLASTDVVLDSPTNNFCVINSMRESLVYNGSVTLSEGNLQSVDAGTTYSLHWTGTFEMTTGKWYWEILAHTMGGSHGNIGLSNELHRISTAGTGVFYGNDGKRNAVTYFTGSTSYGDSYTSGDIIGIAFDADNETVTFYKNNSSQGAVGSVLTTANGGYFPSVGDGQNSTTYKYVANWGQDSSFAGNKSKQGNTDGNGQGDFYYEPPSGYLALCSANLPETTLSPNQDEQADDHFNNLVYTGDGSSSNAITGVGFQPDWVWIKANGSSKPHGLHDSSRVISGNEEIWYSNSTSAGNTGGAYISSFDSDGFTLNNNTSGNGNGVIHAVWNWKAKGGTLTSNSNGSITSNTQANTDAGLSIVTWTGNQTNGASVGHGLGVVPELVIIKNRDSAQGSVVNVNLSSKYRLNFNSDAGNYGDFTYYNGTYTSDNIVFNNAHGAWNGNTDKMVAYVFHSVAGYSRIGTYTGLSSTNNTFVYTGFRPKFIIIKNLSTSADWLIRDDLHSGYYTDGRANSVNIGHEPNEDNALTGGSGTAMDFVSNGFKIRHYDTRIGASNTYFYYAIAHNPIKFNNAR